MDELNRLEEKKVFVSWLFVVWPLPTAHVF